MEKIELTPALLENPQSGCGSVSHPMPIANGGNCVYPGIAMHQKGKRLSCNADWTHSKHLLMCKTDHRHSGSLKFL